MRNGWCAICSFYHPNTTCDTRCYSGIGGLGLIPCHKTSNYMLMMLRPRPDENGKAIIEAAGENSTWERHWVCKNHIKKFAEVFIPGPTEIRIIPIVNT